MKFVRYQSRVQAGELLADYIGTENPSLKSEILKNPSQFLCFAIPNGGVPITEGFCSRFGFNYDVLIVRKIKIPYNTEAGFGSITTDGTVLINKSLLSRLNLSDHEIESSIELTKKEINDRLQFYNKMLDPEDFYEIYVKNKSIFMLDDGLASGFTMLAAISMVKKYKPKRIFIAVPTAPLRTVNIVKKEVDNIFCPNIRDVLLFAVADAYQHWYDVPESEVLQIIQNSKYYLYGTQNL